MLQLHAGGMAHALPHPPGTSLAPAWHTGT